MSVKLDSLLAEYSYPSNPKNAARAGYMAAVRLLDALTYTDLIAAFSSRLVAVSTQPNALRTMLADAHASLPERSLVPLTFPGHVRVLGVVDGEVQDLATRLQVDPVTGRVTVGEHTQTG